MNGRVIDYFLSPNYVLIRREKACTMFHPGTQDLPPVSQGEWRIPQAGSTVRDVVLQTVGLTKAYGKRVAVKDLSLEVVRGEVFGFLGPNGAGKTTTIRLLLNLIKPTRGEVRLFGKSLIHNARSLLPRVGALIEQPEFQSYLSGRDNLIAAGGYTSFDPRIQKENELKIVGMNDRRNQCSNTYHHLTTQQCCDLASIAS